MLCPEGHISQITMTFEEAWNGLNHHHLRFLNDLPIPLQDVVSKFKPILNMQSNYNLSQKNDVGMTAYQNATGLALFHNLEIFCIKYGKLPNGTRKLKTNGCLWILFIEYIKYIKW